MHAFDVSRTWIWDEAPAPSYADLLTSNLAGHLSSRHWAALPSCADPSLPWAIASVSPTESRVYDSLGET
jgi:hypothetical protein